jgi:hypothetical protein
LTRPPRQRIERHSPASAGASRSVEQGCTAGRGAGRSKLWAAITIRQARAASRPGQSGNPAGRARKAIGNLGAEARKYLNLALTTLVEICKGEIRGSSVRDRLAAAMHLLDRGYGQPTQAIDLIMPGKKISELSTEELIELNARLTTVAAGDGPAATGRGAATLTIGFPSLQEMVHARSPAAPMQSPATLRRSASSLRAGPMMRPRLPRCRPNTPASGSSSADRRFADAPCLGARARGRCGPVGRPVVGGRAHRR